MLGSKLTFRNPELSFHQDGIRKLQANRAWPCHLTGSSPSSYPPVQAKCQRRQGRRRGATSDISQTRQCLVARRTNSCVLEGRRIPTVASGRFQFCLQPLARCAALINPAADIFIAAGSVVPFPMNPRRNIQHSTFNAQPRRTGGPEFEQKLTKLTKGKGNKGKQIQCVKVPLSRISWFAIQKPFFPALVSLCGQFDGRQSR
jgi:hypothetical protein